MRQVLCLSVLCMSFFLMCLPAPLAASDAERHYCTQYGPFYLRFDPEKAAGVFTIFANGDMGSVVGTLDDQTLTGEWIEVDNRGPIRIEFSPDWTKFDAFYALAAAPDTWHGDWRGHLRPQEDTVSFERDGRTFQCKRP